MRIHGLLCVLVLGGLGCESIAEPALRDDEPFIVGPVVAREAHSTASAEWTTIHVKENEDGECGMIFGIGPDTEIARATGEGSTEPANADDLRRGATVAVWLDGGTFDSCPGQGGAEAVEILSS